ncbi:MAG TPA: hypothetical protein VLG28_00845 [Acidimicrobiia bacterium]|nr:hypothetical protein [Acidimicrobiia bacterium]
MTHGLSASQPSLARPKRRWWPVPVAVLAGLLLGLSTGSEPLGVAVLFGVIAAIAVGSDASAAARRSSAQQIWAFLNDARNDRIIDVPTYTRLIDELRVRGHLVPEEVVGAAPEADDHRPVPATTAAPAVVAGAAAPAPAQASSPPVMPAPVRRVGSAFSATRRRVGALPSLQALRRFWTALVSDFAVQGLGSLGVLLVFTGTLGFVLFAFTEVGAGFRPAAEVTVPVVLAALSWFLYQRSARFVAAAMEFLAGAVTPVMALAAFVDGAPVPPDLDGAGLVAVLSATSLALAVGYAGVVRKRPTSPLRFLVAPLIWLAIGVLGFAIHAGTSAAQMALVTATAAGTPWLLGRMGTSPLATATKTITPLGLLVGYALTIVFALGEGGAPMPVVVAGAALLAAAEVLDPPLSTPWIVQAVVVVISVLVGLTAWPAGWVGVAAVAVFVALAERWGRCVGSRDAVTTMLAGAGAGLLAAATEPASLAVAAAAVSIWSHLRRVRPLPGAAVPTVIAAALAPAGLVIGLGSLLGIDAALLGAALTLAIASLAVRRWMNGDVFYAVWMPVATLVVVAVGAVAALGSGEGEMLIAAAMTMSVVPIAVSWLPAGGRIWLSAAMLSSAALLGAQSAHFAVQPQLLASAAVGVVLVVLGARRGDRSGGHVALVGHGVAGGAVAVATDLGIAAELMPQRWLLVVVLFAWAAGWLIEVAVGDEAPLARLFAGQQHAVAVISNAVLLLTLPVIAVLGVDLMSASTPVIVAITALAPLGVGYVVAGRRLPHRPLLQATLFGGGVALAVVAATLSATLDVLVSSDRSAMMISLGALILTVVAAPVRARRAWMEWIGWAATAPLAFVLSVSAGLEPGAWHWAWFGWGALVAVVAFAVDDLRNGQRAPGTLVAERRLLPPVVLGVVVAGVALMPAAAVPFAELYAPAIAAAALALVLALQLRLGAISGLAWLGGMVAAASLLEHGGWSLAADPWPLVVPALAAATAGLFISSTGAPAIRWDIPAWFAAAAGGVAAVVLGLGADATASTWVPVGAACLVVAALRRVPALAIIGVALLLGAAWLASPAWFAVALATTSLAAGFAAALTPAAQQPLQWASALAGGGAWAYALAAAQVSWESATGLTLLASAGLAVAAGVLAVRHGDVAWSASRLGPWCAVAAGGLTVSLVFAGFAASSQLFWLSTGALVAWSIAAARTATVLDVDPLRGAAVAMGTGAAGAAGLAAELTAFGWVVLSMSTASALTVLALTIWQRDPAARWVRALAAATLAVDVAGLLLATQLLPGRSPFALLMLGGAAQALAAGIVTGRAFFLKAVPGLVFGAWVLNLHESLFTEVQWVSTPAALAMLAIVEIGRWDRRRTEQAPVTSEELRLTELAALALLVGPALLQTVLVAIPYGLLAIGQGVVIAIWGAATRVRRRVGAGGAAVVLGALLTLVVPLAALVPEVRGIALWAALGTLGAVLLAIAATIEQTRRKVAEFRTTWNEATAEWE